LKFDKYRKDQAQIRDTYKQIETLSKLKDELDVSSLPGDLDKWVNDKNKVDRFNQWIKDRRSDIYLDQAVRVMSDMINQQNIAKAKQAEAEKKPF
jgi:carboxyl-terminal processing protease